MFKKEFSFTNQCEQLVIITNEDEIASSYCLVVKEEDKSEFRLYLSSNAEIDTLIEMLKSIKS